MEFISKSREETHAIAKEFLNSIEIDQKAVVASLQGDLGAGKTSFTQEAGKILGVEENMHSPTFVIMKVYDLKPTTNNSQQTINANKNSRLSVVGRWSRLIHIDAYRLEKDSELLHLGWEELIREPENLVFIEWPERVSGIIPTDSKKIFFEFIDEGTRKISYEK